MDERVLQLRVGVVVLSSAVILGILILMFGEAWTSKYTIYMDFPTAPGVSVNTPVRKNGILIGRISNVETLDEGVRLTARIKSGEKIFSNEVCKIKGSFLGDAVIDFVPGPDPMKGDLVDHGEVIQSIAVTRNPLEAVDMVLELEDDVREAIVAIAGAGESIDEAGRNVSNLTQKLDSALGDPQGELGAMLQDFRRISTKAELALDNFNLAMGNINDVVGDPEIKAGIKNTLRDVPEFFDDAKMTLSNVRQTLDSFQRAGDSAEENLKNLEGFTGPLGENGAQIVGDLQMAIEGIGTMVTQIGGFTETLAEGDGTLGLLINDPQLYNELLLTIKNVEEITRQARPVVNNLNVLSDKMARDPSVILRGSDGLKGSMVGRPAWSNLPR